MDLLTFLQQLINGLSLGSLYALIAIGYTLVYGILRLINFAHGDLLMVAAYVAVMGVGLFAWPWPAAFGLAVGLTGLMGVLLERGAYRPLRRAPRISLLISAIAASFLLENVALGAHTRGRKGEILLKVNEIGHLHARVFVCPKVVHEQGGEYQECDQHAIRPCKLKLQKNAKAS